MRNLFRFIVLCAIALGGTYAKPVYAGLLSSHSSPNGFAAGTLDIALTGTAGSALGTPFFSDASITPGYSSTKELSVENEGSLGVAFEASAAVTSGDSALCDALDVEVKHGGSILYTGSLTSLSVAPGALSAGTAHIWTVTLSLSGTGDSLKNKPCGFDIIFRARQTGSDGTWGLTDEEKVSGSISSGTWATPETVTVRLFPTADTWLKQANPAGNYGTDNPLVVKSQTDANAHALWRFDLTSLPPDAAINSCNLNLYLSGAPPDSRTHGVHLLTDYTAGWGEGVKSAGGLAAAGESSWSWYGEPGLWNTPGGDYAGVPTATVATGTVKTWRAWNVSSDCTARTVYTWLLKDENENSPKAETANYKSREAAGTGADPFLEVNFTGSPAATGHLVINEVYYDVAADKGADHGNEWVELYNPTASAVDISAYKIKDATLTERTLCAAPAACSATSIPPYGFAVISPAATTWTTYWPEILARGAVTIALGANIGSGLNDGGDRVILKDPSGTEVDAVSWGSDTSAFVSKLVDPDRGWSLARLIKGFDTDSATDFWANPSPNPGTNPEADAVFAAGSRVEDIPEPVEPESDAAAEATPTATMGNDDPVQATTSGAAGPDMPIQSSEASPSADPSAVPSGQALPSTPSGNLRQLSHAPPASADAEPKPDAGNASPEAAPTPPEASTAPEQPTASPESPGTETATTEPLPTPSP
ncbi:lamin tail domain-containing protein [Patescibacteria group bacterium]|nr:lamin tail domain-containing protein [Patescibacteria group bacterium]